MILLSLHPGPPSETSAFRRMRAFSSRLAGPLPLRTSACSCSRSCALNRTTYFFTAMSFPAMIPSAARIAARANHLILSNWLKLATSFNNVKSRTSKRRPRLINKTQHNRNRAEFQPERRIMADFNRSIIDVAYAARRFRTIDGINSDDNQIAVRLLGEQRTKGRVSGESAVPIWLAINLHGAKELRQAR